jgi:hypothetical protein
MEPNGLKPPGFQRLCASMRSHVPTVAQFGLWNIIYVGFNKTRIGQTLNHARTVVPALVELPQRQQPGIGTHLTFRWLDNHRKLWEKIKRKLINTLRRHTRPPCTV